MIVILLLFYLFIPAGIIWLCRKVPFFNKIGPILILYFVGIIVGNLPWHPQGTASLQNILTSAIIPLAIPMMLFNSDFKKLSLRDSLLTLLCGAIAVIISVIAGYLLFRPHLGPEGPKIGGMLAGLYTGGTPNLAALKLMLNTKEETFILLNSYDMLVSFIYLVFLMTFGIRLFRKFLLPFKVRSVHGENVPSVIETDPYRHFFTKKNVVQVLKAFSLAVAITAVSAGVAMLAGEAYFMVVVILMLSTLGIAASFLAPVRRLEKSFDAGMYLVYIFCVVVASMADLGNLDFKGGLFMLLYVFFVIFVSLIIQALLSKLMRIDADTMVMSSVAFINSPPLVPMMAAAMKNRDVIITGLGIGIVGYAVGNYLGFLFYELFKLIG